MKARNSYEMDTIADFVGEMLGRMSRAEDTAIYEAENAKANLEEALKDAERYRLERDMLAENRSGIEAVQ